MYQTRNSVISTILSMMAIPQAREEHWMDSIDVAAEIKLIKEKKSKLSRSKRDALLRCGVKS